MILNHIADGAGFFVEFASPLHAEVFRHGDLYGTDVRAIPKRLQKKVGEAGVKNVLDRFLAEKMIDPEDGGFREKPIQNMVQPDSRAEIAAKWLFHHNPGIPGAVRMRQALGDGREHTRWNSEIMQGTLALSQKLAQACERRRVAVIAVHILE